MTDWNLPKDVRVLLRGPVGTIGHLEVLLALARAAPLPRTPGELAEATRLPAGPVLRHCLEDLTHGGLAVRLADANAYRYEPRSAALAAAVDALADAYLRRPVALARALYGRVA